MMASINFKRDVLPHAIAILIFFILTAVYFSPVLFDDKSVAQHDILQSKGGSKEIQDYRARTGEETLWTNSMFGGMPSYLINTHYTGDLSGYIHKILTFDMPAMAANIFITLLCAYILMVMLGLNVWLSVVGAIAFAFTSYNIIILEAGHNTKSLTIAYIPLVLGGMLYALRRNLWIGTAIFALGLTLNIHFNHLQMTYYMLLMVLVFIVVEIVYAVKEGTIVDLVKRGLVLGVATLLAVGVNFGRLYTTAEYSQHSIRGKSELSVANSGDKTSSGLDREYAFNWSYGVSETMTLLIPNFYGGSSTSSLGTDSETYQAFTRMGVPPGQAAQIVQQGMPMYWGAQPMTSGPVYVGAIICFLFVLGLFIVNTRTRVWLLVATLLSFMLAWGKNFEAFNYFMFDYFPGYNKFRAVSSALVIAQITMPLLGMLALYKVFRDKGIVRDLEKKVLYAGGITAGICLLVWLLAGSFGFVGTVDQQLLQAQYPVDAIRADRESLMRSDAFRSFLFVVLAAGLLYFYLKNKFSATLAIAGIGVLILVDLWSVDKRYLNESDFKERAIENHFQLTQADRMILQDKDLHYRVFYLPNPFNDARTSWHHKSVGGYHGAKMRRYQDVIDRHISQNNLDVLRMLNTRYIITGNEQQPVQRLPGALGNAWFVEQVEKVNSPDEEIEALNGLDAGMTAIVDASKFEVPGTEFNTEGSTIKLTEYEPNYLKYEASAAEAGFVVFSEIYYADGWKAFVDGNPVEHVRANYILRAMPVPAGKHVIEFRFEPKSYEVGNAVSLISSFLLLIILVSAAIYGTRNRPVVKPVVQKEIV
ncbi:YfhO family protein [Pontibacter qinzhouensis]|uniref:YfhO family protein n=1 Tax=Pontibacter qinzhouensis TaxID=2603253 RepID=A0A5C8J8S5_9BACT|nr:YfhO family protein [Pontibacter qinzhouensis]TXK33869.1 YfhO family protein [Pontibacter qinzhouensis]